MARGCIRQRSKGSWFIEWEVPRGADGKRQKRSETLRGTKKEAQSRLTELLRSLDTGAYVDPVKATLGEWLREWLAGLETTHGPKTREGYEFLVRRHIEPHLGSVPLTRLTPAAIQKTYTVLLREGRKDGTGGLAPQSVRHVHNCLSAALTTAVKLGLLTVNPIHRVDAPAVPRAEMSILDADQTRRLLAATRGSVLESAVLLAATAGLRRGECLGLKWADVDLDTGRAAVRRSRYQVRGTVGTKAPKSGRARVAMLPAFVLPDLRRIKGEQAARHLSLGAAYDDGGWVCCWEDGSPIRPDYVSSRFPRLLAAAGLPRLPFHSLRHGCATLLLQANVHPKVVAEALGHSSTAVTLAVYSHVTAGLLEDAAKKIDAALRGSR